MCTLTGGIEQGNIAGPAAPLGGGRSDCPLVLELLLGRLNADPIILSNPLMVVGPSSLKIVFIQNTYVLFTIMKSKSLMEIQSSIFYLDRKLLIKIMKIIFTENPKIQSFKNTDFQKNEKPDIANFLLIGLTDMIQTFMASL